MSEKGRIAEFPFLRGPLTVKGRLLQGYSAACLCSPGLSVVLVCATIEELRTAWHLIAPRLQLDEAMVQQVIVAAAENVSESA